MHSQLKDIKYTKTLPNEQIIRAMFVMLIVFISTINLLVAQENRFVNYGVDQGLPQAYIYTISQNPDGYLWVGTANGLASFDGLQFTNYNSSDSLGGDFITCTLNTEKGDWFGHNNGNLSFKNSDGFYRIVPGLNTKSTITDIGQASNGNIWFSNQTDGLVRIDQENNALPLKFEQESFPVFSFEFIGDNELLIGTVDGLKYCRYNEKDELKVIRNIPGIVSNRVKSIEKARTKEGYFILSGTSSIYYLTITNGVFSTHLIGENRGVDFEGVQSVFEDQYANLWISTFGEGVHVVKLDTTGYYIYKTYNESNGLQSDNVKLAFEDSEGNIWLSVYGKGLSRLIDPAYTFFVPDNDRYGTLVSALYVDSNYKWLGTEKGLLRQSIVDKESVQYYDSYKGLPFDKITALYKKDKNDLWIGTEKNGVYRLNIETDKLTRQFIDNGILENSINSITGNTKFTWIATKKGACCINSKTNELKWYTISKGGLPHNCVNHILIDSKNRVWFATLSSSIAYLSNGEILKFNLSSDKVRSIEEDSNGNIWVGTLGSGVFLYQDNSLLNITNVDGLLSDYCYSLTFDHKDRMWITHRGGLSRLNINDLSIKPLQDNVGINKSDEFQVNAGFVDGKDNLWFGLNHGVFSFNPTIEKAVLTPPLLKIKSVRVNDEPINFENKIVLKPGRYKIKIEYVGIHFKDPSLVKYRHILDGYDDNWSDFTTNSEVIYHGVNDGHFNFRLEASNSDGLTNEQPLNLQIYVKTPFWKQAWFYLVLSFLSIVLIIIYIKQREKKLRRENRVLEEKVNERTIEVVKQKEEIEKQRDLITIANKDITDSIKYASKIQAAIVPPTKYLESILDETFIINKPKAIVSGDFYWFTKVDGKTVVALADCTGHGVPGAFMSMLGVTLLNEIVNHKKELTANVILNQLRENVIVSLRQSHKDKTTSDGMDISLVVLDHEKNEMSFSGAFNPLIIVRDNKLITVKADRMPIGIYHHKLVDFTNHKIEMLTGDMLYLYTDGYPDQFGGENDRKFTSKKFKNMLLEIHEKPMMVQKTILENTMKKWMNGTEQIDDITIMGIRI